MKWMSAAALVVMAVGTFAACSSGTGSSGSAGEGGSGGDVTTSQSSSSSSGTGGMGGSGGAGGQGGGGGSAATCDDQADCMKCQLCAQGAMGVCYDENIAMQVVPDFKTFYMSCVTPCASKPPLEQGACLDACCATNQAACDKYKLFSNCVTCDGCRNSCNPMGLGCN